MNSHLTEDFVRRFRRLPRRIQDLARKNYRLWKRDPAYPSLDCKRVSQRSPIFAVRVGIGWRAVGVQREGQYSIRINDQWRMCFEWRDSGVYNVEIVDYH